MALHYTRPPDMMASPPGASPAAPEPRMIGPVDCHAHVFTRALTMAPDARFLPEADAPIESYLALLDAHAIAGGVLVQPSFLGTDNGYLLAAVARAPERLRAVAVVAPTI